MIIEQSITQVIYISILTNIQLMFLLTIKQIKRNVKKTYYDFTNDVVINKHNTINANDTYNATKTNKSVNFNDAKYFTKKTEPNNNTTNNVTRHDRNNYEHNAIKKVHKHIKHVNNYDTEIN